MYYYVDFYFNSFNMWEYVGILIFDAEIHHLHHLKSK